MSYLPQISYSYLNKFTDTENTIYECGVLSRIFGRNRHGATGDGTKLNNEQHRDAHAS
jgi:hypothetical protein